MEKEKETEFLIRRQREREKRRQLFRFKKLETTIYQKAGGFAVDDSDTKKILKIIHKDNLTYLIGWYRLHSSALKRFKTNIDPYKNFPKKEIQRIDKVLGTLKKKEWLSDIGLQNIQITIKEQMAHSDKGSKYIVSAMLEKLFKTRGRRLTDPYLHLLIYILIELIKKETKKANFPLIANFLSSQGITDFFIGEDRIRKIYNTTCKLLENKQAQSTLFQRILLTENLLKTNHEIRVIPEPLKSLLIFLN